MSHIKNCGWPEIYAGYLARILYWAVYKASYLYNWTLTMIIILYILTGLAFACVVLTLVMGTVAMSKKSEENRQKSNKWMWRRIYAQVSAILLLGITMYMRSKGA